MTKCKDCLAYYKGKHKCFGLMKELVKFKNNVDCTILGEPVFVSSPAPKMESWQEEFSQYETDFGNGILATKLKSGITIRDFIRQLQAKADKVGEAKRIAYQRGYEEAVEEIDKIIHNHTFHCDKVGTSVRELREKIKNLKNIK